MELCLIDSAILQGKEMKFILFLFKNKCISDMNMFT